MTIHDTNHWTITEGKKGLLLFAQAMEELVATHSHDSYKVPVLNFHCICFEILTVIDCIEENILDRGNLLPLYSELKSLFLSDDVAQQILGTDFDALFAKKNIKGEYDKTPIVMDKGKDVETNLSAIKNSVEFIASELGRNNQYYNLIIQKIKELIRECDADHTKMGKLYQITRTIASELINIGFNQAYIHDQVESVFFKDVNPVLSIDTIDSFFEQFSKTKREYVVYLPIESFKQKKALQEFGNFKIEENVFEMFNPPVPYILKYETTNADPYEAREEALNLINFSLSVSHFIKHNKHDYHPRIAEVVDKDTHKVYSIRKPEQPITCSYGNCEELQGKDLLHTCIGMQSSLFQVLQLHSAALKSHNTDNQIINLWTAVEVAIPVVRKDSLSRINQISNVLSTTLSYNYFDVLLHQLYSDIRTVGEEITAKIDTIQFSGGLEAKLAALITLQEYSVLYTEITTELLNIAPLLACRMQYYKSIWIDSKSMLTVYQNHIIRISQQIMRIYRTRNMLVHDGSSLPYAEYVLQNLHYYIDSYIAFLYNCHKLGYDSVQASIDAAFLREQQYIARLKTNVPFSKDNLVNMILSNRDIK